MLIRDKGAAAPWRWPSGHLQPQITQRLTISLQLAALNRHDSPPLTSYLTRSRRIRRHGRKFRLNAVELEQVRDPKAQIFLLASSCGLLVMGNRAETPQWPKLKSVAGAAAANGGGA